MSAITSATAARGNAAAPVKPPTTNLDAEKAKCESQLADWVHCVSATTPEGKAKIEEFSAKLSAINAKIKQSTATRADGAETPAPSARSTPTATLGNAVDVFV